MRKVARFARFARLKNVRLVGFLTGLWLVNGAGQAIAHGVEIEYEMHPTLQIQANYDSGDPLGNAAVVVYAPDNPAEPWLTGMTNAEGQFSFNPDLTKPGDWEVKVRQAGHGDIVRIPIEMPEDAGVHLATVGTSASSFSPVQKVVMSTVVVWGFVGTALFFAARKG